MGGDPTSHTPAPESAAAAAPFQAWRGSQLLVARGPAWVTIDSAIHRMPNGRLS